MILMFGLKILLKKIVRKSHDSLKRNIFLILISVSIKKLAKNLNNLLSITEVLGIIK
jgi:hypothetical protein